MTKNARNFISRIEKYEKNGINSMDWVEWESEDINENIIEKFNIKDWSFIKGNYENKSNNLKSLIANHINLNKIELADIELEILTKMIRIEQIDVAYQALNKITFGFVTSGEKHVKELKGVFLSEKKEFLIAKYFTQKFLRKVIEIANECGEFQKNEIKKFLEIIDEKNTTTNTVQKNKG